MRIQNCLKQTENMTSTQRMSLFSFVLMYGKGKFPLSTEILSDMIGAKKSTARLVFLKLIKERFIVLCDRDLENDYYKVNFEKFN